MDPEEPQPQGGRRRVRPATGRQDLHRREPPRGRSAAAQGNSPGEHPPEGFTDRAAPRGAAHYAYQRGIGAKLLGCLPYVLGAFALGALALIVLAFGPPQEQDDIPILDPVELEQDALEDAPPPPPDPAPGIP